MVRFLKKTANSKLALVLALVLLFACYGLRIIHLDQDLPAWGVGQYQPKDEGCYAILAINEWEYGTLNPGTFSETGLDFPFYIQEHVRINLLGNLLEMASFHLFGDNYYGLRMPMVLIGALNLMLLGLALLELRRQYGRGTIAELWGILGMMLLMSFHFYFYLSSRTVEPSTLRMLFTQLTFYLWLKLRDKGGLCFFAMGACITVSVFLVYITNVFLYLAVALLLVMIWVCDGFKTCLKYGCAFVAGVVLMFAAAELYYRVVWDTSAIRNTLSAVSVFNSSKGYEIAGGENTGALRNIIKSTVKYFSAFFFLYAPGLLGMSIALLPVAAWQILREKDKTVFFLLAVLVSFLLQTMYSEDYIWRNFW